MAGLECQAGKRCRQPTRWCRWTQSRQNTLVVYTLVAMEDTPDGLTDSLYWRRARDEWHCFKKLAPVRGLISLCQRREIIFVRGQQIGRPEAYLRCSVCDEMEMARRGGAVQVPRRPEPPVDEARA
jgi:hypothetical protein